MARRAAHTASRGDNLGGGKRELRKSTQGSSAKTMNTPGSQTKEEGSAGGDADESDHADDMDDEPDANALSGAQTWNALSSAEPRLAGLFSGDVMFDDEPRAEVGASMSSDEDDYADVEDVSDDEESLADESDRQVRRAAEMDLIEEFERTEQRRDASAVTAGMGDMFLENDDVPFVAGELGLQDDSATLNLNEDPFFGLTAGDDLYQEMWNDAEDALATWRLHDPTREGETGAHIGSNKKRVRFEETRSRSSSLNSSEDPNDVFPDLFAAQDDPAVLHRFAIDLDIDATFQIDNSDKGSCYDFDGEAERMAFEIDEDSDSDDSDASSFNTEDEGETTDEECEDEQLSKLREMQKARAEMARAAPKTPPLVKRPVARTSRTNSSSRPSTPKSGSAPRMGTFSIDPTRASMSADPSGKQIKLWPPTRPPEKDRPFWERVKQSATRNGSPRSSAYLNMRGRVIEEMPQRPFTAQSTLGSLFNGNLDILRNNDVSGIVGDLFPAIIPCPRPSPTSFTPAQPGEPELQDVDMRDFLDIASEATLATPPPRLLSTPPTILDPLPPTPIARPQHVHEDPFEVFTSAGPSTSNPSEPLPRHITPHRDLIASFRRNQSLARHVSSLASHPATRASTSEGNALLKGRRAAANTPITPARRKRTSLDLGLTGSGVRKSISGGSGAGGGRPRSRGGELVAEGMRQTLGPSLL